MLRVHLQLTTTNRADSPRRQRNPQYFEIRHQGPVSSFIPCVIHQSLALTPLSSKPLSGNIKRIIIFSSTVSVGVSRTDPEYTEEDWNDASVDDVKANGKAASGFAMYSASKTLAERGMTILTEAAVPLAYAEGRI